MKRIRRALLDGPVSELKAFLRTRGPPHPRLKATAADAPESYDVAGALLGDLWGGALGTLGSDGGGQGTGGGESRVLAEAALKLAGEDGALKQALRDAAGSRTLVLARWGANRAGSGPGGGRSGGGGGGGGGMRLGSRGGGRGAVGGGGLLSRPEGVAAAVTLLDTFMAGDAGGHFSDDAFGRVRPAASCLTKLDLSGCGLGPALPRALTEKLTSLQVQPTRALNLGGRVVSCRRILPGTFIGRLLL